MKKKILGGIVAVAIAAVAAVNVNFNNEAEDGLSALSLANVQALADGESGGGSSNWTCWSQEKSGSGYWRCGNPCTFVDGAGGKGPTSKCYSN